MLVFHILGLISRWHSGLHETRSWFTSKNSKVVPELRWCNLFCWQHIQSVGASKRLLIQTEKKENRGSRRQEVNKSLAVSHQIDERHKRLQWGNEQKINTSFSVWTSVVRSPSKMKSSISGCQRRIIWYTATFILSLGSLWHWISKGQQQQTHRPLLSIPLQKRCRVPKRVKIPSFRLKRLIVGRVCSPREERTAEHHSDRRATNSKATKYRKAVTRTPKKHKNNQGSSDSGRREELHFFFVRVAEFLFFFLFILISNSQTGKANTETTREKTDKQVRKKNSLAVEFNLLYNLTLEGNNQYL